MDRIVDIYVLERFIIGVVGIVLKRLENVVQRGLLDVEIIWTIYTGCGNI